MYAPKGIRTVALAKKMILKIFEHFDIEFAGEPKMISRCGFLHSIGLNDTQFDFVNLQIKIKKIKNFGQFFSRF